MAGLRVLLCLGALLACRGSAGKGLATPNPGIRKPSDHVRQGPTEGHVERKGNLPPLSFWFLTLRAGFAGAPHRELRFASISPLPPG